MAEVNISEQSADKIKSELITLLHRSVTTPINRDQSHTLTIELDLVLNARCAMHVRRSKPSPRSRAKRCARR